MSEILKTEFDGRSLSDPGVHIIDPFVGTGNFIVRIMQEIDKTTLADKYAGELHCNEVMLLPYYVASMNIEHEFYEATNTYQPFEGICLVDSFETAESQQLELFTYENTERVKGQKDTDMFVIIGNPPYNVGQVNENDNNKNRKYETVDKWISETYAKASKASNKNKLSDAYVKAILWGLNRIGDEGIVAFVTNNSFLDAVAFDGMRKHLAEECDAIYILDLGGNARKGLKVSDANVFGIRVGVSINLFVKTKRNSSKQTHIFYHRIDEEWNKAQKFEFLKTSEHLGNVPWQMLQPDGRYTWLTEGLHPEFEDFIPIGTKEAKTMKGEVENVIFHKFGNGIITARDAWAYNCNRDALAQNMILIIEAYNAEVDRWNRQGNQVENLDAFVLSDDTKIKWSSTLKQRLKSGQMAEFADTKIRQSLYRPFTKSNLFFDRVMNHRVHVYPSIFPIPETEAESQVICVSGLGHDIFRCHITNRIVEFKFSSSSNGGTQCFPFYTYDEDGTNRRENITDWALAQFRAHYQDDTIEKWDIFHYVYALLHHPDYRERYEANLKRDPTAPAVHPGLLGVCHSGQTVGGNSHSLRRSRRISAPFHRNPRYPAQLARRKDETVQRQYTANIQRVPNP